MSSQPVCAMIDEVRLLRLLRAVADDVGALKGEATADEGRRSFAMWLPGVKNTFVTAIEACVDIAQHLCSVEGWGPPADNGDAIRLLGSHRVLSESLAESMRKAVGFRNVLVHEYVDVSDEIVAARLKDLSDLDSFLLEVTTYMRPDR